MNILILGKNKLFFNLFKNPESLPGIDFLNNPQYNIILTKQIEMY